MQGFLCISAFCGLRITYDHTYSSVLKRQLTDTKDKQTLTFTYRLPKTCCLAFKIMSSFWAPIDLFESFSVLKFSHYIINRLSHQ